MILGEKITQRHAPDINSSLQEGVRRAGESHCDPCQLCKASLVNVEEKFVLIYQDYQGASGFDFVVVFLPSFLSFFFF